MTFKTDYSPPISDALAASPIRKFMTKTLKTVDAKCTVRAAMKIMIQNKVSGLPVIKEGGKCLGIYSEFDAVLQGASQPLDNPINFSKSLHSIGPDTPFKAAILEMVTRKVRRLPILDPAGFLLGLVSRRNLMQAILNDSET